MKDIVIYVVIFYFGGAVGFLLHMWLIKNSDFDGTITVTKNDDKTLYSLILEDDPENLEFKEQVVFRVTSEVETLDRE